MAKQNDIGWDDMIRPMSTVRITSTPENKRKRRFDDRRGTWTQQAVSPATAPPLAAMPSHTPKRLRTEHTRKTAAVPVARRLELLDTKQLTALVAQICETHPEVLPTVNRLAPAITVDRALATLEGYLKRIGDALPYKGDPTNDYAYLRVQEPLQEFFTALADYTAAFLPPHELQPVQALEFLDGATNLVHRLPQWSSEVNNRMRNRTYEELGVAWAAMLRAVAVGSPLGLPATWESRARRHNENAFGRLFAAIEALDELSPTAADSPAKHISTAVAWAG